ncbi:unnamed protein product [Echinostoma caproni]|uniref:Glyco_transf_7C domain-containing protein n=1 Tax=Echinostoma caproni TaxID=27848 RepID=A0A183BF55_9TREM|nr:unnamed protein product [Echinostoma caproni]
MEQETLPLTNGFPNRYWGWGNEDDELAARCYVHGLQLSRPPTTVGRFRAVRHLKATRGSGHYDSFRAFRGFLHDGLTALNDSVYQIIVDHSPERFLNSVAWSSHLCDYSRLLHNLNISVTEWTNKTRSGSSLAKHSARKWDQLARLLLYTHLVVDTKDLERQTILPSSDTRESWYWFLHFYGWI